MEGSYCNTCHRWIGKGTLEYFMTEGYMSIRMALYNRSVKSSLPSYLKALCSRFESHAYIASLTERQAETLMWVTYALLALHGVNDNEACVELKP